MCNIKKVQTLCEKQVFLIINDNKVDLRSCSSFNLIYSTERQLGRINRKIIHNLCDLMSLATHINQWQRTHKFLSPALILLKTKKKQIFIKYGIKNFYPSILK